MSRLTKEDHLSYLQKLIARWDNLLKAPSYANEKYYEVYEQSKTVIKRLCGDAQEFIDQLEKTPSKTNIERFIGKLRATHHELNSGFLNVDQQIQGEISIDLMQQAEGLLIEGKMDKASTYQHVPAAVLAGAVLEHFLRTLCERQSPPISLRLENSNFKTLATLVNDLEKCGLYNEVESKQLKVWVKIRNSAAHGQFAEFTYQQVVEMIADVKHFIDNHK